MTTERIDLQPCPFCGEHGTPVSSIEAWVECSQCQAQTRMYNFVETAINVWNTRVQPPASSDAVDLATTFANLVLDHRSNPDKILFVRERIATLIQAYVDACVAAEKPVTSKDAVEFADRIVNEVFESSAVDMWKPNLATLITAHTASVTAAKDAEIARLTTAVGTAIAYLEDNCTDSALLTLKVARGDSHA